MNRITYEARVRNVTDPQQLLAYVGADLSFDFISQRLMEVAARQSTLNMTIFVLEKRDRTVLGTSETSDPARLYIRDETGYVLETLNATAYAKAGNGSSIMTLFLKYAPESLFQYTGRDTTPSGFTISSGGRSLFVTTLTMQVDADMEWLVVQILDGASIAERLSHSSQRTLLYSLALIVGFSLLAVLLAQIIARSLRALTTSIRNLADFQFGKVESIKATHKPPLVAISEVHTIEMAFFDLVAVFAKYLKDTRLRAPAISTAQGPMDSNITVVGSSSTQPRRPSELHHGSLAINNNNTLTGINNNTLTGESGNQPPVPTSSPAQTMNS